jgi:hypothetical protein
MIVVPDGLEVREECYLCDQATETIDHILCSCPFTREIWFHICQAIGRPLPRMARSVFVWWKRLRGPCQGSQRKDIDSLFALTSGQIWKEKNARCFREATTTVTELLPIIKAHANLRVQAGANDLRSLASGVAHYPPSPSM